MCALPADGCGRWQADHAYVRHGEIVFNQTSCGWVGGWLQYLVYGSAIPLGINDQSKNEQGVLVPVWTGVIRRGMQLTLRVRQSDQQNNSTDANMGVYRVLTDLNPATAMSGLSASSG